jgi:hypothetical protein
MSYDNLSSISQNVLKFYQQLTGEERRIPFIFDDFHFCRSRVIALDRTENRIFTLCRMITWVVFLRMFWNFISSLPVKTGGSLSFLVGTIRNILVMEIGWTDVGSGGYILVSCAHSNTSCVVFCGLLLVLFFFGNSNYIFWLTLSYLQTFLRKRYRSSYRSFENAVGIWFTWGHLEFLITFNWWDKRSYPWKLIYHILSWDKGHV